MSATARKRKEEVAQALRKLIQSKGKTPAMKYQQLFDDLRGQSEAVCFPWIIWIMLIMHRHSIYTCSEFVNCNLEPRENLNLNVVLLCQAITKDMFDEALRALADEDYLTVTGKTVRLLWTLAVPDCCRLFCYLLYPILCFFRAIIVNSDMYGQLLVAINEFCCSREDFGGL